MSEAKSTTAKTPKPIKEYWESEDLPFEKVWDQVQQAKELGFSLFTFEIVHGINPQLPPFVVIRATTGTLPV